MFCGRDEDIAKLTTFIKVEKTTVLYGKSGLGKTSLLNAGVLPVLEKEHQYRVISVRFGSYTQDTLKQPLDIVEEKIAKLYDHRDTFLSEVESEDVSLWQQIKSLEQKLPKQTTFLLVFDQFEEVFTYPKGIAEFAEALADLLYNRVPKCFQRSLRLATRENTGLLSAEKLEWIERPLNIKVLMSIRSDRMSLLDGLSSEIPSILLNCYELKPLSRQQAQDAITIPTQMDGEFQSAPFTYQPEALKTMLDFLTEDDTQPIETFQLQVLCQHVEENIVIDGNDTNVEQGDLGDLKTVYQDYYINSIKKLGTPEDQLRARVLIEEGLILEEEQRRIPMYDGQIQSRFSISPEFLRRLTDTHIIRSEPHSTGGFIYEICHDTLVAPILSAKADRNKLEEKNKRKRILIRVMVILITPLGSIPLAAALLLDENLGAVFLFAIAFALISWFFLLGIPTTIAFFYEFIMGESLLSKLRKRAGDPKKQKGILTKIGRWLS